MRTLLLRVSLATAGVMLAFLSTSQLQPNARATFISSEKVALVPNASGLGSSAGVMPTSGTVGGTSLSFADFEFTDLAVGNVSAANLSAYDTLVLLQVDASYFTTQQKADINSFVDGGGKLIIYDSDATRGVDYSWLVYPFSTYPPCPNCGLHGGTLTIVEDNTLSSNGPASQYYIATAEIPPNTDAVGDANVMATRDPNWFGDMEATNARGQTGWTHAYAESPSGAGVLLYNGIDTDYIGRTSWSASGVDWLAKLWYLELKQQWDPSGLPGGKPVAGQVHLAPLSASLARGQTHTITATVTDTNGSPLPGLSVDFSVTGVNPRSGTGVSDTAGRAAFSYTGSNQGRDTIVASATISGQTVTSNAAHADWTAPVCHARALVLVGGTPLFGDDRNGEKSLEDWTAGFEIRDALLGSGVYGSADVKIFSYSGWVRYTGQDTRQSLSTSADRLDQQLRAWAQECASHGVQTKFDVVAHSLGGAVTAYWAGRDSADLSLVRTVLTINSPLGGIPAGNCVQLVVGAIAGQAGLDLCDNAVKDTMKRGVERLPWLAINNRADWVVNGCVAQGMNKADGKLNGTLSGRLWDSKEIGVTLLPGAGPSPLLECLAVVLGVVVGVQELSGNPGLAAAVAVEIEESTVNAHGLPLKADCRCWDPLKDKLLYASLYDDRASQLAYSARWKRHANSTRVMSTDSVSSEPGSTLALDAPGVPSKIVWIAMKGPQAGHAKVSICGGSERDINLWHPLFDARQEYEFAIPSGCAGPELRIRVPTWIGFGKLRGPARDVNVDAFEVWQ